ncbi:MAG: hypothetical protein HYS13_19600 [Planctomycetia bacterium]|nr:hypothetical protein [Planctomycetia bacterium]
MRRALCGLAAAVVVITAFGDVHGGDWFRRTWDGVKTDWRRNNAWPEPFNYVDRDAAVAPFAVMIAKGWQVQHTLGAHHFDPETSALTELGKAKVEWILTQAPAQHRTVFVEQTLNAEETAARMTAVQSFAVHVTPAGTRPEVYSTSLRGRLMPADEIYMLQKGYQDSIPQPRLPAASTGEESP